MSAPHRMTGSTRRWVLAGFIVLYAMVAIGVATISARSAKSHYSSPMTRVDALGTDRGPSRAPRSPATGPTPVARSATTPSTPASGPPGELPTTPVGAPAAMPTLVGAPAAMPTAQALGAAAPAAPRPAADPAARRQSGATGTAPPAAQAAPFSQAAARAPGVVTMPATVNLARNRPVNVTSHTEVYAGQQATDGDVHTYWEGQAGFPQTLRVDLGAVTTVGRLSLYLPPVSDWGRRVQTLSIRGSRDGASFTRLVGPAAYVFDANSAASNAVVVSLASSAQRYLELRFTANDGWKAAQLSELQVWSS
ncbi:discoidin domain-containing protein [Frankia tisae]|uniref:discoidin domain-containing protein n=1 Tax=Frankia tisae TaxID=2950104 RepID=UPI0021C17EEF|nr:discoidin domain-containing protein [Frankia tisae]